MNKSITLHINTGCNLHCNYCIQNTQQPEINEKEMFNKLSLLTYILKNINKPDLIILVGGEPGLWSYELLNAIIKIIDSIFPNIEILVDTNGLFMKKFPFTLNDSRFKFSYHITNPESYDLLNDPYIKLPNVTTVVVITKSLQNNKSLVDLYKKECSFVTFTPCRIYENSKLESLIAYDSNLESCFYTKKNSNINLFESDACYSKIFEFFNDAVYYYTCCRCCYNTKFKITENTDFTIINKELIPMEFVKTYCNNCGILSDKFILK